MAGDQAEASPRWHRQFLQLCGHAEYEYTSGSDHDAVDPSFSSQLNNGFFFPDDDDDDADAGGAPGSPDSPAAIPAADMVRDAVRLPPGDQYGRVLARKVARAVEKFAGLRREGGRAMFLRAVMGSLREGGYDAGVCKARWGAAKGITPGSYEYVDVVRLPPRGEKRYIVDVSFAPEFEIARPSAEYESVLAELPQIYVGSAEELKKVVTVMADVTKGSMTARGMHVPPWRKRNYMRAKWLGPYKRTINHDHVSAGAVTPVAAPVRVAKADAACHKVGFEAPSHVAFWLAGTTR